MREIQEKIIRIVTSYFIQSLDDTKGKASNTVKVCNRLKCSNFVVYFVGREALSAYALLH